MSRKLLLFGGLSVASIATITPTGIHFQKEAQKRKERQDFINASDDAVDSLNGDKTNESLGIFFIKNNDYDDKGKLMWVIDIGLYYTIDKKNEYTSDEINHFEKTYWEEQVSKELGKGKNKVNSELLERVNKKSKEYWEKYKEICLVLLVDKKITEENMKPSEKPQDLLCSGTTLHSTSGNKYRDIVTPKLEIMKHFGKDSENGKKQTTPSK